MMCLDVAIAQVHLDARIAGPTLLRALQSAVNFECPGARAIDPGDRHRVRAAVGLPNGTTGIVEAWALNNADTTFIRIYCHSAARGDAEALAERVGECARVLLARADGGIGIIPRSVPLAEDDELPF